MSRRRAAATIVAAVLVALAGAGEALAAGTGWISGTVAGATGPVCVSVLDGTGQVVAAAASDSDGRYTVPDVPAGSWVVEFLADGGCLAAPTDQALQYYAGKSTPAAADRVTVTAGQVTTGVDATLEAAAKITGIVTDRLGVPLADVCVLLEDTAGGFVLQRLTSEQGTYALDQLPRGAFVVQVVDDGCVGAPPRYASRFYGDAATAAGAKVIELAPGRVAPGVDVALDPVTGPQDAGPAAGPAPGAPGAPASPGGVASGAGAGATGSGPAAAARSARIDLLAVPGGRYRLDRRHRLRLRLRCARGGLACAATVRVVRPGSASRLVGARSLVLPADGRARTVRVALRLRGRAHVTRLRVVILLVGVAQPVVTTTIRMR